MSNAEIQLVCKKHYLGKCQKIFGTLPGGLSNQNVLVKTEKGRFVIRFFTSRATRERTDYIQETILFLKKASLPVLAAIKNKEGENFSLINNRMVQVYPY